MLKIANLSVSVGGKKILESVSLQINHGEIHVLMGPNGAGKTSLAMAIMGNPRYQITGGQMTVDGKDIAKLTPDERAKLGIFISFQKLVEIPGVSVRNLLRMVVKENFEQKLGQAGADLKISQELMVRSFENFSGGEAKKIELLQAKALSPHFLILDEIDSGLDVDNLKLVAENVSKMTKRGTGILLITHYPRILKFIKSTRIHVLIRGYIVKSGGVGLANEIEKKGYLWIRKRKD